MTTKTMITMTTAAKPIKIIGTTTPTIITLLDDATLLGRIVADWKIEDSVKVLMIVSVCITNANQTFKESCFYFCG